MSKQLKPELRFPEFDEDWFETSLEQLMTFKNGVNASKENYGFGYKFINVLDIIENDFIVHDLINDLVNIPKDEFEKNIVEYGDILFQRSSETRAEVGQANVYIDKQQPATFGGFVIRGKKKSDYNPFFINYLLKTRQSRLEIMKKSGGSTRYNVGQSTLSEVVITTTVIEEQQKIANFLKAINKRIKLLKAKKDALEDYKTSIMQKLFAQEIRFKQDDGSDFPEWEQYRLGEIGSTLNGLTGKTKDDFGEGQPYIQYMQIFKNSKIDASDFGYVNITPNDNQTKIKYGDILFTTSSETREEVGTSSVMLEQVENLYLNSFSFGFRLDSFEILIPEFARYLFRSYDVRKMVVRLGQGSTRYNMSKVAFMKDSVTLPVKEEQIKIARILSNADEKIERISEKIDVLTDFKQSLLQKLFV